MFFPRKQNNQELAKEIKPDCQKMHFQFENNQPCNNTIALVLSEKRNLLTDQNKNKKEIQQKNTKTRTRHNKKKKEGKNKRKATPATKPAHPQHSQLNKQTQRQRIGKQLNWEKRH